MAAASRKLGLTLDATSPYIKMANKILEGFPVYIGWVGKSMGRGLFAARDIQRGELVLKEEPWYTSLIDDQDKIQTLYAECLAQDYGVLSMITNMIDSRDGKNIPFSQWPEMGLCSCPKVEKHTPVADYGLKYLRKAFEDLPHIRNDVRKIYHPLRSRIVTNAFCQDNHQQIRLYCAISLLNHSCFPNIYHTKDTTGELFAVVDIPKGTQLIRRYLPPEHAHHLHQENIFCEYDADCRGCTCMKCHSEESHIREIIAMQKFGEHIEGVLDRKHRTFNVVTEAYHDFKANPDQDINTWIRKWKVKCKMKGFFSRFTER